MAHRKKKSTTNYLTGHMRYLRDPYLFFTMTIGKRHSQHLIILFPQKTDVPEAIAFSSKLFKEPQKRIFFIY